MSMQSGPMQQPVSAGASLVNAPKAGFWIRFVAILIDGVILLVVNLIVSAVLNRSPDLGNLFRLVLGIAYFSYFWSNSSPWRGQTVGMKLLNLRVVRTDGSDLTILQGFIRYVGLLISCLAILIGVIWVAFDPNKQGGHDKIASTYVVKTA